MVCWHGWRCGLLAPATGNLASPPSAPDNRINTNQLLLMTQGFCNLDFSHYLKCIFLICIFQMCFWISKWFFYGGCMGCIWQNNLCAQICLFPEHSCFSQVTFHLYKVVIFHLAALWEKKISSNISAKANMLTSPNKGSWRIIVMYIKYKKSIYLFPDVFISVNGWLWLEIEITPDLENFR